MKQFDAYYSYMNKIDENLAGFDLNLITALDALLNLKSVSQAADKVGRTQSAMSHSLSRLRDHFRDPLLVRDGWTMHLTPMAESLRPRVADAAKAAHLLFCADAPFDPATTQRRVRIASPDLCASLFTPLIDRLAQNAPGATVELVPDDAIRQAVLNSDADIGLVFGRPKLDANLVLQAIGPLAWCTFAPHTHPYCSDASEQIWTSSRHIVVRSRSSHDGPVEMAMRKNGMTRQRLCYAPNFSSAMVLAAETGGLFTTLRAPFDKTARRLDMTPCPTPFDMLDAPAFLLFRKDYGDPFVVWLRDQCLQMID